MAVPTSMADLSTTANSNSPAGSESPISTDDFLRAIQSILRHTNAKGADIASATTTNIGAATGEFVDITGTTTITGLGTVAAGIERTVRFTGALTLTHNATSLILPGGANITTAANDTAVFRSLGSGNWLCILYKSQSNIYYSTVTFNKGADVASATALPLISDGNYFDVTGTTTVTSINSVGVGTVVKLHFDDALILTHHATDLILPGGQNITTAAGDEAEFVEYASGDWRCTNYVRASGPPYSGWTIGSEVSTSGALPITVASGIPSWVTYIQILFDGVSLSGTDNIQIQLNEVTSGYTSDGSSGNTGIGTDASAAGFVIRNSDAGQGYHGIAHLSKGAGNKWFIGYITNATGNTQTQWGSGNIDLGATLTSIRINKSGTNTADGGVVTVKYQ